MRQAFIPSRLFISRQRVVVIFDPGEVFGDTTVTL